MKQLSLTTWERAQLIALVNQQSGDLTKLRRWLRVLDVVDLSEDEKEAVGWEDLADGRSKWEDGDRLWELHFEDADFALLATTAIEYPRWPVLSKIVDMLDTLEKVKNG